MRPTPYVASLRVYEPIDSFDPGDQARWRQIKITETTGYEEELRELFKKVDWSEIDPTIEEIEDELESEVDRFMSLSVRQYRKELGFH